MATALYRRYRPESFADVIGQDHVTTPLRRALRNGRVGHAYLFSGPRGCGKTTSARILARCLNCAEGPTDTPCGQCDSCRDLSRGGAGSLDVVEIDAASHGGVDDARELRERATFAPARDRFKVFIIDEAHMVTSAGFNALLKLVEEPPEHVKFVFATTEPDKVIGTIRSRTHHYPFRLIPPQVLLPYLDAVCDAEGVRVGEGVLPLVVRAGGGSARDTMSVLDQLMAGAGEDGLDQQTATALLGFTDSALLDRAVVAVGQRDGAALYGAVEQVLATGHEPRRFVEDLLERVRDLIVLSAVPEGGAELLPHVPAEDLEQMRGQASTFQPADLSRCGDLIHETLTTMSGATSPRLHLELLAARLVLRDDRAAARGAAPAQGSAPEHVGSTAQGSGQGAAADRSAVPAQGSAPAPDPGPSEHAGRDRARRIAQEQGDAARRARSESAAHGPTAHGSTAQGPAVNGPAAHGGTRDAAPTRPPAESSAPAPGAGSSGDADAAAHRSGAATDDSWGAVAVPGGGARPAASAPSPADREPGGGRPDAPAAASRPAADRPIAQSASTAPSQQAPDQGPGRASGQPGGQDSAQTSGQNGLDAAALRGHWPAILEELSQIRRPAWALISQNGHVHAVQGSTVVIGFRTDGLLSAFHRGTTAQNLVEAIRRVVGQSVQIDGVVGEDPGDDLEGPGPAGGPRDGAGPGTDRGPAGQAGPGNGRGPGKGRGSQDDQAPREDRGPRGDNSGPRRDEASRGTESWGSVVDQMGHSGPGAPRHASGASSAEASAPVQTEAGPRNRAGASRVMADDRDLPPDPEDPYPPEPDEPNPFDEDDGAASISEAPVAPAPRGAWTGSARPVTSSSQEPAAGPGGAEPSSPGPAAAPTAAAAPAPVPAPASGEHLSGGDVPEVDDERRDDVPDGQPRTHGQAALRRAIAEDRTVRTREIPRPAADRPSHDGDVDDRESPQDSADAPSRDAETSERSMSAPARPSSTPHRPGSGAVSWDPEPSASTPAAGFPATPGTAPQSPPTAEPAAAPPAGAAVAEASGAELARRAAQASRIAAQDRQTTRSASPGPPAEQVDPTGGASRDDADASVARRNGREVIETVLGGRVLEIIDETRG